MRNKRIYLLDDDPEVLNYLELILCSAGSIVKGYSDPQILLKEIAINPPDIVFLDIELNHKNMTGIDILKTIKKNNGEDITIIMLTQNKENINIRKALIEGANQYICKPIIKKELFLKLEQEVTKKVKLSDYGESYEFTEEINSAKIIFGINIKQFTIKTLVVSSNTELAINSFIKLASCMGNELFGKSNTYRLEVANLNYNLEEKEYLLKIHFLNLSAFNKYKNWLAAQLSGDQLEIRV